ncbi:MAG TPA: DUF2809 domain-containing protein [bacterium]|nr:DUF2809 domain-containing protein [bacterium]
MFRTRIFHASRNPGTSSRKFEFLMRIRLLISILFLVPAGFFTKLYAGPASRWVYDSLGGVLYVIFWCLAAASIRPQASPLRIGAIVFFLTSLLEFSQLWHPAFLIPVRENFLGRTLIGHAFAWSDFPHYLAGALLGVFWIVWIRHSSEQDQPS